MERGFKWIVYFFGAILLLAPIGFHRYIGSFPLFEGRTITVHFHAAMMVLWCVLLITQPILIQTRNKKVHALLGQISFGLVPIIVLSMLAMISYSYQRMQGVISEESNLADAMLPFTQLLLFAVFYILAMIYKSDIKIHMRYIIISSVSLLGPTVGRIDFGAIGIHTLGYRIDLFAMDLILAGFCFYDLVNKRNRVTFFIGFIAYATAHIAIAQWTHTPLWQTIARAIIFT